MEAWQMEAHGTSSDDSFSEEKRLEFFWDALKYLAGLSTGAFVVVGPLLADTFANPTWPFLMILGLLFLLGSVVTWGLALFMFPGLNPGSEAGRVFLKIVDGAVISFLLGCFFLLGFISVNML